MKRSYELTFIVRLEGGDDSAVNTTVDQVRGWVETQDLGQVTKIDRWGRRKLAYEIDGQREGYYVLFDAQLEPRALFELERSLNLAPNVLRYLLVRCEE
ncbi:MAG: 30S ribosomal protein S6 [Anaerolineae bacterium]|nr:30S ribosomal protein S6 [Anaerolineae bacterium]MCK6577118.1 30S ribosomal protein S6 [Anaerolineae bacterium]NUQ02376.1 30S ribosomal protein S6 [Anaerolineae bacterium]